MSDSVLEILSELAAGHLVLVTDDHHREDEADLLMAAQFITVEKMNFLLNHGRGLITNPISDEVAKKLKLPLMVPENVGTLMTAFTVSIDAIEGTHTGISSHDRVVTIKKLSDPNTVPSDFERPGHIFPLIGNSGGINVRPGHTEAAIELMKLAKLHQVAVLCETLNENGEAIKGEELLAFSKKFKIKMISIAEIANYLKLFK